MRSGAGMALIVGWLAAGILWPGPTSADEATNSCLGCHDDGTFGKVFMASAHARAGMTCVDCHGGDPTAIDESAHKRNNFHKPVNKQQIAELCSGCHSDVRRMNPYGLPADQLDRYKTSKHGERLFGAGDQNVAVCTDCHGVHDIAQVKSPDSHVYPTHVPDTCGKCHANATLMAQYQIPADVVEQYKSSYHATMVFEKGDLSAPTCVTCHGNHGATPPSTSQVGQVCGKCHGRQRELFEKSPHFAIMQGGAFNECVECHGNHAIRKASVALFAEACARCHSEGDRAFAVRDSLAGIIGDNQSAYDRAAGLVKEASVRGFLTEDQELMLQEDRTSITQLEALQHTLTPSELKPAAEKAQAAAHGAADAVTQMFRFEQWKRLALFPAWVFLGFMAIVFWRKRAEILKRDAE